MPAKRPDKDYLVTKIKELYKQHTAPEISDALSKDPNITGPITVTTIRNLLTWMRKQHEVGTKEKPWTEEEHQFLVALYEERAPIPKIAERLERSIPAIHARISQCGLANRKTTEYQAETVRHLLLTTKESLGEIAYQMNLPYSAVKHVWDQVKTKGQRRRSYLKADEWWKEGSLAERLLRQRLIYIYREAVIPWQHNREWSKGRGYQIDIPIDFSDGTKFAVEVNHTSIHARMRNRDYAKRIVAEMEGWLWIPIWYSEPPTLTMINEAVETIRKIIDEKRGGGSEFYTDFITQVAEQETKYYAAEQPVYDPKEHVNFGSYWDEADVSLVIEHYGEKSPAEIQGMLSTLRTQNSIKHMARKLGLTKRTRNFTQAEDETIREVYATASQEEIEARLPGRSWQSITSRASRLGIRRRDEWTPREEVLLRTHYSSTSDEEMATLLPGRSTESIRTRANRLGLKKDSMWSEAEDELLGQLYPDESRQTIHAALSHRSWTAIISRASRLGIRRTSPF